MIQRVVWVSGFEPAISKEANLLMKAFDLGVEGAYRQFTHKLTITLKENSSLELLDKQLVVIKSAYEKLGCVELTVYGDKVL